MKLKSLLDRDFINPRAKVSTKDEAIDLVLKQFFHGYKFKKSQAEIKQAILEREALGGTLLENGMAIPHARLDGFNDLLIGIVIPEQPIIDEDGSKINSLVIFLTTKAGFSPSTCRHWRASPGLPWMRRSLHPSSQALPLLM